MLLKRWVQVSNDCEATTRGRRAEIAGELVGILPLAWTFDQA